jgi:hypothetical protein
MLLLRKAKSAVDFYRGLSVTPRLDNSKKISYQSSSLNVPLAIDFENRSSVEMTIAIPNIQIYYQGEQVGQVSPNSKAVKIKQYATSTLSGIVLNLPLLNLISVAGQIISSLITEGSYNRILNDITMRIQLLINNKYNVPVSARMGEKMDVESGIGLIPYSQRKIKPLSDYAAYLPPKTQLKRTDPVLIPDGTVEDTVRLMHQIVRETANDTKMLAQRLRRNTLKETLQAIFDFVYTHIAYEKDSIFQEQVRRPLRTLYDQKGDCDCYATLIGSILYNMEVPFKFRIAEYANRGYFQHVYVIVPHTDGYFVVDPVLDNFNQEKPTTKHKDF